MSSTLPVEIQQLVLENLELPRPLFRPNYGTALKPRWGFGEVQDKHYHYWGPPRSMRQNEAVATLLNLAQTGTF